MRLLKSLAFMITLLSSTFGRAEYRVFLLKIENVQTKESRLVTSTLDPLQYPKYNTVTADERVSYTETWRCFGRTGGFADFCPNPKAQPADQIPANNP